MSQRRYEIKKINDKSIVINIFKYENVKQIYYINEKGLFLFSNEQMLNDCLTGKKTFLIGSICYNGYEGIKEIKYLMKKINFEQNDINILKESIKNIKI